MLNTEEKKQILYAKVMETLAELVRQHVPETGRFKMVFTAAEIPGCPHEVFLDVQAGREDQRYIRFSLREAGTNRLHSHNLFHGDKTQVLAWLSQPGHAQELDRSCARLMESILRAD